MSEKEPHLEEVSTLFIKMGADPEQAGVMAAQLLKRAGQIAEERGISIVEATGSLLTQVIRAREDAGSASKSDLGR